MVWNCGTMSAGQGQFEIAIPVTSPRARRLPVVVICLLLAIILSAGCSRFPAIDPNGQSIFLPHPAATELRVPHLHARDGNPGIIPSDAFPAPAPPPACLDASAPEEGGIHNHFKNKKAAVASHFAKKDPGKCGEIQLTPLRVVAPVNGEVLLLAGICGKDGYLVKREPLEWMLSPDSVGQFIEVGDDARGQLISSLRPGPRVEKLDVDYARGRTSSRETLLTKGTPGNEDDVQVEEGQTWLSISSPSEGVSRVTVLAPESELWDRRRQTAIIYWVDSQANFPAPQVVRAPDPVQLVTRVTRAENLVPAEGWQVRYTIVDPSVAAFVPPINSNIYVARVDANGQATVTLAALPGTRGTTPVQIEVIRPPQASENLPELILQQGMTTVSFSSPGLEVTSSGPQTAAVGDVVTYVATMANPGDIDAENSRLVAILPAGAELVNADPQPNEAVNGSLAWVQNILPAGRQLDVTVTVRLRAPQDVAMQFNGVASDLRSDSTVTTRVVAPSVGLRFEPANNIAQAEIGDVITYEIDITNTGPQTLVDVVLEIETGPGLQHSEQGPTPITQVIPMLQPRQTESRGVAFRVMQEGQHPAVLRAKSSVGGSILAERTASILGIPRRPKTPRVEVAVRVQPQASVGGIAQAVVDVVNRGETVLSAINVDIAYDASLEPVQIDSDNTGRVPMERAQRGRLPWMPPDLQPGQVAQLTVNFLVKAPAAQATIAVTAGSSGVTATAQAQTQLISPSEGPPPVLPPGANAGQTPGPGGVLPPTAPVTPPEAARSGDWSIRIIDLHDPITVGAEARYDVVIVNNQNLPDRDVRVQLGIPQGVTLRGVVSATGETVQAQFSQDSGTWNLPSVQYVRSGDQLRYTFIIVPNIPQQVQLLARVSSTARPNPQQVTEPVTVNVR